MGGSNARSNLVYLTPEEHYIAHQLLVKIYPIVPGLITAVVRMAKQCVSNRVHGWLRRRHSENTSARMKILHKKNPSFRYHIGKAAAAAQIGILKSEEHKQSLRGLRPHVNQTGARNNNSKAINTPYGTFGSIADCLRAVGDRLPTKDTNLRRYIDEKLKVNDSGWSRV